MALPRLGGILVGRGCDTPRTYRRDHKAILTEWRCDDWLFACNRLRPMDCYVYDRLAFQARPPAADFLSFHWISKGRIADFRSVIGLISAVVD